MNKKKYYLLLICLIILGCTQQYFSLEQAIESKGNKDIKILAIDEKDSYVIFKHKKNIVFNSFVKDNNKYKYSSDNEKSIQAKEKDSLEWSLTYRDPYGKQPFIWGVISKYKNVGLIKYKFADKQKENLFEFNIPVTKGTFVGNITEHPDIMQWKLKGIELYTYDNKIIEVINY